MPFKNEITMTIGGKSITTATHIPVINPATETVMGEAPDATRKDLDAAVSAAREALAEWSATPIADRRVVLEAIASCIERNVDELSRLFTAEQGKPIAAAAMELMYSANWIRMVVAHDLPVEVVEDTPERTVEVRRVPVGVVGAIVPWNFPILLAIWKLAPALLTGNTMVLKPSPFTPLTMLRIGELLRPLLPPGVLNVISGGDSLGPWMTEHPGIDKISFTGSSATGIKVMGSASQTLKSLTLELGGNDAAIIFPDVDVQATAIQVFTAAFFNSAQLCVATKRLYVHEDIYDEFSAALTHIVNASVVGNGADEGVQFGPIQNRPQYDRVCDLLQDCRTQGYKFLAGGKPIEGPGFFVPLTLVDNPPEHSRVVQEEAFGPILPILKFRDIEDVVKRANATNYGLAGSVWSADLAKARSVAERLDTGLVWINDIMYQSPLAPFGGRKLSGFGVENGRDGLLSFTKPQTLVTGKKVS